MPPIEKPLIIGRKAIMSFLQISNWDSVQRLIKQENVPVAKIGGRWIGKRENLQKWLDLTTKTESSEPVKNCKNLQDFTPQNAVNFTHVWSRWRTPKMELFLVAYREHGCLIARACKTAGITRPTFYNWQKNYERFKAACEKIQNEVGYADTAQEA